MAELRRIQVSESIPFIKKYHYTSTCANGVIRYGWFQDDTLIGVSVYDTGTRSMQKCVFGESLADTVLHHHRLALIPGLPKNTASQFIAACLKQLKVDRPHIRAVVTYADLCLGHAGTIYKATNALYTGVVTRGNIKYLTRDLKIVNPTSLKGTWPQRREEAYIRGWREFRCQGKLRFVYLLGNKTEKANSRRRLRLKTLSYPNLENWQIGQLDKLRGLC